MLSDNSHLLYQELDGLAWKAIQEWPEHAGINVWKDGLNYQELSSWFLWDKARTAVIDAGQKETLASETMESIKPEPINLSPSLEKNKESLSNSLRKYLRRQRDTQEITKETFNRHDSKKLLYVPIVSERLESIVHRLLCEDAYQVVSYHAPRSPIHKLNFLKTGFKYDPDRGFAGYLFDGVCRGFKKFDLIFPEGVRELLEKQLVDLTATVVSVEQEMQCLKPDAVLVHGDNHPPHQIYVMVARKMGLPSIMLQHGLDCERYYLDEAYATAIAVWGAERERRYRQKSSWQPRIRVVGNPQFDSLRLPEAIDGCGSYWLWLTRPHTPEKCYAPSRSPEEGLAILKGLMKALDRHPDARLLIKAHPYDYPAKYLEIVAQSEYADRIKITQRDLQELFSDAAVVITEDSTAGMEAMFWGRPIVHAHFAPSEPTMPFVEYGAALPGFSEHQLMDSIASIHLMNLEDLQQFHDGQIKFLTDFAGPCDGQASDRVVSFIADVLGTDEELL